MRRLPVSGLEVTLLAPTGQEDVLLLEAAELDLALAVALLERLAIPSGSALDLASLVVTDYEALLLAAHAAAFGDQVTAETVCGSPRCRSAAELSFGIDSYIAHHKPGRPRSVAPFEAKPGWFELRDGSATVRYRLPTVGDLAAAAVAREPEREVLRRCVDGPPPNGTLRRKLERAMEAQAPSLSGSLQGRCPECRATLHVFFDVERFVLSELREQAAFVYHDTHLLALHYHWPEGQILEMPHNRRMQYAEMLRGEA